MDTSSLKGSIGDYHDFINTIQIMEEGVQLEQKENLNPNLLKLLLFKSNKSKKGVVIGKILVTYKK